MIYKKVSAIMLAAGRGTRMKTDKPKVLHTINRKPIALLGLSVLKQSGIKDIIVVVGYKAEEVKQKLGSDFKYIYQAELLGTGHAVSLALPEISPASETVLVANGDDTAFFKPETIQKFLDQHLDSKAKMSIVTCVKPGAEISGRVIRNGDGRIIDVVANSELSPEELIKNNDMVCGLYFFDRQWLEKELPLVKRSASGEYFITALIYKAIEQSQLNNLILEDSDQWQSINTQRELRLARQLYKQKK